jgi:hypothetical protein
MTVRLECVALVTTTCIAVAGLMAPSAKAENPLLLLLSGEPLPVTVDATGGSATFTTSAGEVSSTAMSAVGECREDGNGSIDTRTCKGSLIFTGVKSGGAKCKTVGANAEEVILSGEVDVVDILAAGTLAVGLLLVISGIDDVSCGVGLTIEFRGAVIGHVLGVENGVESAAAAKKTVQWRSVEGKQEFRTCDLPKSKCEGKTFNLEAAFIAGNFKEGVKTAEAEGTLNKMWTIDF